MKNDGFLILVNDKEYDVATHYADTHKAPLPATPTMTVLELAGVGGYFRANPTHRPDGSRVTSEHDYCVCEVTESGDGPVYTVLKDAGRSFPLSPGQRFAAFPQGYY